MKRRLEHVGVAAFFPRPLQEVLGLRCDAGKAGGPGRDRGVEIVECEHPEPGDDLGDGRPQVGHSVAAGRVFAQPFVALVGAHFDRVVDDVVGVAERDIALTALARASRR